MATYLYRLGAWSFEHRRRVLAIWALVLLLVGASAAAFAGRTSDKFSVPGTESQQAQDLLEAKYPGAGGAAARVVFAAPEGETLAEPHNRAAMEASLARASKAAEVDLVIPPFKAGTVTEDKRVAFADVIYPVPADEIDEEARDELAASAKPARAAGLQVEFGGRLVTESKEAGSESAGMLVAYAVLAVTLASLLAAGLPLITALIGVSVGLAGVKALSGVIDLSETAPALASMLGLAVGIDYALFIASRHRQQLAEGMVAARVGGPGDRHRRQRRRLRGPDRGHRAGRARSRGHPVPDRDGPGRGRHRRRRRADRDHAAACDPRLRRAAHRPRESRAGLPAVAALAPSARDRERALGDVRHPPPAAGAARRPDAAVRASRSPRCT